MLLSTLLLSMCCATVLSCSKERPPSLPLTGIYNRSTSKIEVAEVIVNDHAQGAKVRNVYQQIAHTVEVLAARRAHSQKRISATLAAQEIDQAQLDSELAELKQDEEAAFDQYIARQLELRKLLTEHEFTQLGSFE